MNSCRSIEFWACAPPLITFSIGTGSVTRLLAAEVAEERDARPRRPPPSPRRARRRGSRSRRGGPCSACRRARSARWSRPRWSAASKPAHRLGDLAVDVGDRLGDALAAARLAAVAQLERLVHAGRRARGHRRAARRARLEADLDLDGRVAARVEDLPRVNCARSRSCACSPWRGRSSGPARRAASSVQRLPSSAASRSACSTRATKRSLVARSASSGSTFRRRATLTAAKSTSPSSLEDVRIRLGLGRRLAAARDRLLQLAQLVVEIGERARRGSGTRSRPRRARRCTLRA